MPDLAALSSVAASEWKFAAGMQNLITTGDPDSFSVWWRPTGRRTSRPRRTSTQRLDLTFTTDGGATWTAHPLPA